MGFPLSVFCSGHPMDKNKSHIFASAVEIDFLLFKEQVPLNLKIKYQQFNAKGRPFYCYHFRALLTVAGLCL
jgi:hypothetical protein